MCSKDLEARRTSIYRPSWSLLDTYITLEESPPHSEPQTLFPSSRGGVKSNSEDTISLSKHTNKTADGFCSSLAHPATTPDATGNVLGVHCELLTWAQCQHLGCHLAVLEQLLGCPLQERTHVTPAWSWPLAAVSPSHLPILVPMIAGGYLCLTVLGIQLVLRKTLHDAGD